MFGKSPNTVHTVMTCSGNSLDWAKNKFRQSIGPSHGFCFVFCLVLVLVCLHADLVSYIMSCIVDVYLSFVV